MYQGPPGTVSYKEKSTRVSIGRKGRYQVNYKILPSERRKPVCERAFGTGPLKSRSTGGSLLPLFGNWRVSSTASYNRTGWVQLHAAADFAASQDYCSR